MAQMGLFSSSSRPQPKPVDDRPRQLQMLITVKAAPTPSATYGETVRVAETSTDLDAPGWLRLYPINFRYLQQDITFSDDQLAAALRERFLTDICRQENDVAFFVGNPAKRRQTFSALGVYYPRKAS